MKLSRSFCFCSLSFVALFKIRFVCVICFPVCLSLRCLILPLVEFRLFSPWLFCGTLPHQQGKGTEKIRQPRALPPRPRPFPRHPLRRPGPLLSPRSRIRRLTARPRSSRAFPRIVAPFASQGGHPALLYALPLPVPFFFSWCPLDSSDSEFTANAR